MQKEKQKNIKELRETKRDKDRWRKAITEIETWKDRKRKSKNIGHL